MAPAMRADVEAQGGIVRTSSPATAIHSNASEIILETPNTEVHARYLVNCAGLYADVIARRCGLNPRGPHHSLPGRILYAQAQPRRTGARLDLSRDRPAALPFLGVHFTRRIHGGVEAGPNAVFALAREGYGWTRISAPETFQALAFAGFWRMAARWWRTGAFEFYRSLSKAAFVKSLQKLVPDVRGADMERGGAGVRAQAVNERGELLDDFSIVESPRAMHVLNAPSPAATASLALGEYIAARARALWLLIQRLLNHGLETIE